MATKWGVGCVAAELRPTTKSGYWNSVVSRTYWQLLQTMGLPLVLVKKWWISAVVSVSNVLAPVVLPALSQGPSSAIVEASGTVPVPRPMRLAGAGGGHGLLCRGPASWVSLSLSPLSLLMLFMSINSLSSVSWYQAGWCRFRWTFTAVTGGGGTGAGGLSELTGMVVLLAGATTWGRPVWWFPLTAIWVPVRM